MDRVGYLRRIAAVELRRFCAFVTAFAVVTAALLAGHVYFYCAPMDRITFTECCSGSEQHDDEKVSEGAFLDTAPHRCCDARRFDRGDPGFARSPTGVAPPVLASLLAIALVPKTPLASQRAVRGVYDTRAGPRAGPLSWRTEIDVSLS